MNKLPCFLLGLRRTCRSREALRLSWWETKGLRWTTATKVWKCSSHLCCIFVTIYSTEIPSGRWVFHCIRWEVPSQRVLYGRDSFRELVAPPRGPKFESSSNDWGESRQDICRPYFCFEKSWVFLSLIRDTRWICSWCSNHNGSTEWVGVTERPSLSWVKPLQAKFDVVISTFSGEEVLKKKRSRNLWILIVRHGGESLNKENRDE